MTFGGSVCDAAAAYADGPPSTVGAGEYVCSSVLCLAALRLTVPPRHLRDPAVLLACLHPRLLRRLTHEPLCLRLRLPEIQLQLQAEPSNAFGHVVRPSHNPSLCLSHASLAVLLRSVCLQAGVPDLRSYIVLQLCLTVVDTFHVPAMLPPGVPCPRPCRNPACSDFCGRTDNPRKRRPHCSHACPTCHAQGW